MAKAVITGVNPYLPLKDLENIFDVPIELLSLPSPHPPFVSIISIPMTWFSLNHVIIGWFIFEILCLISISIMLTILWKGTADLLRASIIFFVLLAWYPVMYELLYGQLTIPLTTLVLAALLLLQRNKNIMAGIFLGLSVAIKMFTWPIIVYLIFKRDWRTVIASCLTIFGLNLSALLAIGIGPFSEYYLKVISQISAIYILDIKNKSLMSIGYRFFNGTTPLGGINFFAPPLIKMPRIAPIVSVVLVVIFFVLGLIWAKRCKNLNIAYSIMICVLIAISPIVWGFYYIMLIITVTVLFHDLSKNSFPTWYTIISLIIVGSFFLLNDYIDVIIFFLNHTNLMQVNGIQITFASSLLEVLPLIELIILAVLLWQRGITNNRAESNQEKTSLQEAKSI